MATNTVNLHRVFAAPVEKVFKAFVNADAMASWLQTNSERRHNLVIVTPTTPAQYFHCLRRQIHR